VLQQKLWRHVRSRSLLPAVQFVIAIGVIALVIFVLGLIGRSQGTQPQSVLGFSGTSGAIRFVLYCAALFVGIIGGYWLLTRALRQKVMLDSVLLRLPGIGPCVEAFTVARFALALQLTLDTSLPTAKAIRLSLDAAGNAVYRAKAGVITGAVGEGEDLTVALSRGQMLPADFLSMVAVGEEGGRVVEILRHQANHYQEEAGRRAQALARMLTFSIWFIYAAFMVLAILSLAALYLRPLGG
jgi:type IV pilus assembly protein PilC